MPQKGVPEGSADSGWILLDYGEVMVHIMTPKSRLFYDIEGQVRLLFISDCFDIILCIYYSF